jgi:hypothetical protein
MHTRMRKCLPALAVALVLGFGVVASAQTADPYVGTWTMNAAKSTSSGPMPKSRVLKITSAGADTIRVTVEEVRADDTKVTWSFTNTRDGKEGAVTGHPLMETAASTSRGPRNGTTVYKKAGKVVMEVNTEVSADGKTFTTTSKGTDAEGKAVTSRMVYDRTS